MASSHQQLVSVVIRTHNRATSLFRAIECVLEQTYQPIEVLVIDHESTDRTKEVIDHFGDRIRYYKHIGTYRDTFTIVWCDKVRGEFISFLDDDDYIRPDCIEKLAQVMTERKDVDIVFPRHRFFRVDNGSCRIEDESRRIDIQDIKKLFLKRCVVSWNAVMIRRCCLKNIKAYGPDVVGAFDWHMWTQLLVKGHKFYQIDEVLGFIQRSSDSSQFEIERMSQGVLQCMLNYSSNLTLREKISFDYQNVLGYQLIRHGTILLDKGSTRAGRKFLLRGIGLYLFAKKNYKRSKNLIVAILIFFSSLISDPKKSRKRIEQLVRNHYFRNYFEIEMMRRGLRQSEMYPNNALKTIKSK
jgi:glycosyltransferase involved in cell wall biosynthesis